MAKKTSKKLSKNIKERIQISSEDINIQTVLCDYLYNLIINSKKKYKDIIFVCIGTDRSTGDSLAPLVGYKIHKKYNTYGTLHNTVHAKNLDEILNSIDIKNNLIVAIDACLGKMEHVRYITIENGSLKPGSGVGKNLTPVGDISITGIVNFGGFMDFMVLQNTRLSMVMNLSEIIESVICDTMERLSVRRLDEVAS